MAKPMKTPGVYIVEKNAFPNSIVEVETSVPAFIGYSQIADYKGVSLLNKPKEISSLSEFHEYFGFAPQPMFTMTESEVTKGAARASAKAEGALFAAGKVIEAANSTTDVAVVVDTVKALSARDLPTESSGNSGWQNAIEDGIRAVVTAVGTSAGTADEAVARAKRVATELATVAGAAEKALGNMLTTPVDQLPSVVRITANNTSYEFSQTNGAQLLYYSMRMFFQNGGGKCYVVSVGSYEDDISKEQLLGGLKPLIKEQVPSILVVPDAVRLAEEDCKAVQQAMLAHCVEMTNRVAILDVWEGWREPDDGVVQKFRNNIGTNGLKYGAAYYPWLETSVVSNRNLGLEHIENKDVLVKVLGNEIGTIESEFLSAIENTTYTAKQLQTLGAEDRESLDTLNDAARVQSRLYKNIIGELKDKLNLLPPSAAMAGIYTRVDNQRGVWKAPANVSVSMVNRPSVSISHDEQESLNVDLKGKSINAIREFVGEGVMVWGARTLDGNSLDWRYINVRRTMIMLEESTRLASKAFVFEPNTANTWVTMKSMISNFLTGIWKRGGLAGAVPEDAFSVHIGLGETMTPEDILEGIMRITVLVAPTRPAEFIEITFQQQAQKS